MSIPMHTYSVNLTRVDSRAGPHASLRVEVRAPDGKTAANTAQAQFPGYRATGSGTRLFGT